MGTHSQPLLQNRLMDVYKTWQGWSNHGPAHAYRLFGQIRPEVEPRRRKNGSMRGPFSKGLLLQIGMQQQQTECILVSWIEISWLFAVHTDFTNLTVMLSNLLRNLTFNRSAHCTQVSDQCPLGLLFNINSWLLRKPKIIKGCLFYLLVISFLPDCNWVMYRYDLFFKNPIFTSVT